MLETTIDDTVQTFLSARNLNAALKNFLKQEAKPDNDVERFSKDFRTIVSQGRPAMIRTYIEKNIADNEILFLALVRYAHPEFFTGTIQHVIDTYADTFNQTYERKDELLVVKDKTAFKAIVKSVDEFITSSLQKADMGSSLFVRKSLLVNIFDADVLEEVVKVLN